MLFRYAVLTALVSAAAILAYEATAHAEYCETTDIGTQICRDEADDAEPAFNAGTAVTPMLLGDGGYSTMICDGNALASTPQDCEQVEDSCDIDD